MAKLLTIAILLYLIPMAICAKEPFLSPKIEYITNEYLEETKKLLEHNITNLQPHNNKISINTKGLLGEKLAIVGTGETLADIPDDHGNMLFTVGKITKEGVYIKYRTEFDHNSFGKNLITIDKGQVFLEFSNGL